MKKLYRFEAYFGRMGSLDGLFVADDETEIAPAMGKRVYFGEVLGKHSEVWLDALEPKHIKVVTDEQGFIEKFTEYRCGNGYNPLHYISCPECGDTLPSPYTSCACGWRLTP